MKAALRTTLFIALLATINGQIQAQTATNKVDTTGNVGIGLINPSYLLHVTGGTTSADFPVVIGTRFKFRGDGVLDWGLNADYGLLSWDTGKAIIGAQSGKALSIRSGGVERMHITANGYFGIGTSNPIVPLDVRGSVRIDTNDDAVLSFDNSDNSWQYMQFRRSGVRKAYMGLDSGNNFTIYKEGEGNVSLYSVGNVILDAAGSIGVGTTNPVEKLHVSGNLKTEEDVYVNHTSYVGSDTGNGKGNLVLFGNGANGGNWQSSIMWSGMDGFVNGTGTRINASIKAASVGTYGRADLAFYTKGTYDDALPTERLRITKDGNVGIGTNDPSVDLEVVDSGEANIKAIESTNNRSIQIYQQANDSYLIAGGSTGNYGNLRIYTGGSDRLAITSAGNVGIGTITPNQKLTVAGTVKSQEVIVEATAGADFVFEEDYDLPTLAEIEKFIKANKHLEGIPSAKEMIENGVKMGELQIKLLQKIEELTLHVIEQEKKDKKKDDAIAQLLAMNKELLKRIEKLEKESN